MNIENMLNKVIEEVSKYGTLLYLTKFGSKLYGTDDQYSDTDYRGVFVPSTKSLLLNNSKEFLKLNTNNTNTRNESTDIDCHLDSLHKFIALLQKGETNAIDMLFSLWRHDTIVYVHPEFKRILQEQSRNLITSNPNAFIGYSVQQMKMYNIKGKRYNELLDFIDKLRTLESNTQISEHFHLMRVWFNDYEYIKFVELEGPKGTDVDWTYVQVLGRNYAFNVKVQYLIDALETVKNSYGSRVTEGSEIDWKATSHAVRVVLEIEELLETGFIQFPLKYANLVYAIKKGKLPIKEVLGILDLKIQEVDALAETAKLNKEVDKVAQEDILLKLVVLQDMVEE